MATSAVTHAGEIPAIHPEKTGLWSWITTVDHKKIGILYGISAFAFFLIGGLEALLLRIQLGTPDNTFLSPELYNQLFTMHGTTMIFLAVMPMSAVFFNYMIPLQLGARDVAFPRLNAVSAIGPMPVANMWCAHTPKPRKAMKMPENTMAA